PGTGHTHKLGRLNARGFAPRPGMVPDALLMLAPVPFLEHCAPTLRPLSRVRMVFAGLAPPSVSMSAPSTAPERRSEQAEDQEEEQREQEQPEGEEPEPVARANYPDDPCTFPCLGQAVGDARVVCADTDGDPAQDHQEQ